MKRNMIAVGLMLAFATAMWGETTQYVKVPISGEYDEPTSGERIAYTGTIHLVWTPAPQGSGSSGWTFSSVLVADMFSVSTGARGVCYSICSDCFSGPAGTTAELTRPFWTIGLGGQGIPAQGLLIVTIQLPKDAALPVVNAVAFVMR